jgi:hypothetical protein
MAYPEGYMEHCGEVKDNSVEVLRLLKTVNGLKQAPKEWYDNIHSFFLSCGLRRSNEDHNLHLSVRLAIVIYVDDLLLFSSSLVEITNMKISLSRKYEMTDLGKMCQFLGMWIVRDRPNKRLFLHQIPYVSNVLNSVGMESCNGVSTPMDVKTQLRPSENESEISEMVQYQSAVGKLMYGMLGTRPDLAYAVSTLSKFNHGPIMDHHSALKRVFRYLKQTATLGILYDGALCPSGNFPEPVCYTDSDWAGDKTDRKSTGGYVFTLAGGAISWRTKKQDVVATSTTEAEYIALSEATKESIWIRRILREIETREIPEFNFYPKAYHEDQNKEQWELHKARVDSGDPKTVYLQTIFVDNESCIRISENPTDHARTKHIDIRYHFVRQSYYDGHIKAVHVPSSEMTADILTKSLPREAHWKHLKGMGLTECPFRKITLPIGN